MEVGFDCYVRRERYTLVLSYSLFTFLTPPTKGAMRLSGLTVGINHIHCHLLLEESKGQGVQRLACQTLVS